MQKKDVIDYFGGSVREVAEALGVSVQYVYQWPDRVPFKQACRLEKITDCGLRVVAEDYQ